MKRKASAAWSGGLKDGKGALTSDSGVLKDTQYSFSTRFEDGIGTNPEELVAAAHAGCFSMALSKILGLSDIVAESINTTATVSLENVEGAFCITTIHLESTITASGADTVTVIECAQKAKAGCPISKALNAEITLDAKHVG
ncbi:MAG: OsmC family protein [Phycisphaeraceae bacterium]|nr:OsmC family protein [Phycisphaeraceae bacterium]